ncbi:MAG: hypothetical protein LBG99_02855 [Propionibacteriaceae bacterium]|nr:hypothetical protein [Propionibacteriaceae bacterium]
MKLIWATRGRTWGFRFLKKAGFADPLPEYEKAFCHIEEEPEIWRRLGRVVAVRFSDPEARQDQSGRVIPHEFVLYGVLGTQVNSVSDALTLVWPLVSDEFDRIWDQQDPLSNRESD